MYGKNPQGSQRSQDIEGYISMPGKHCVYYIHTYMFGNTILISNPEMLQSQGRRAQTTCEYRGLQRSGEDSNSTGSDSAWTAPKTTHYPVARKVANYSGWSWKATSTYPTHNANCRDQWTQIYCNQCYSSRQLGTKITYIHMWYYIFYNILYYNNIYN